MANQLTILLAGYGATSLVIDLLKVIESLL